MVNGQERRILFTAPSRSGSWAIRGEQLGAAVGGEVQVKASRVSGYDLVVVVKRARPDLLHRIRTVGVPVVWDIVDAWPQPEGNSWGRVACMRWLDEEVARVRPVGLVAATRKMAEDCAQFAMPVLALPHHARPRQQINPIRDVVQIVGYEGGAHYLGHWTDIVQAECASRGWKFVVNPTSLWNLDIVVAFRADRGYAAQHWKSNVKLANAQGSGTPVVLNSESGYEETDRGGAMWANTKEELRAAFDALTPVAARREAAKQLLSAQVPLNSVAEKYKAWLGRLRF